MKLSELKRKLENCSNENERKAIEKEIAVKECQREYQKNYKKAHNDELKSYQKSYREAHKNKMKDYLKVYREEHQVNQGTKTNGNVVEEVVETISDVDGFKYSKEDICNMCNVSSKTFERFLTETSMSNRDFISIGSNHKKLYNEDILKKFQLWLMNNQVSQGVQVEVVKNNIKSNVKVGLTIQELIRSGNVEAIKEFTQMAIEAAENQNALIESQKQNKLLLEQKEQAEANYQAEKMEHQKDKELVLHKYLTATQIKETIWKEYGKKIVVSKAVKRIPLDDNDILYKPFKNGDFTGQQPVYHPNVLDKIREILG